MTNLQTINYITILFFCLLGYEARDQIASAAFRASFPYANKSDVWKLTFVVNHQNQTLLAIFEMLDWTKNNWMREVFWQSDRECKSKFTLAQPIFKNRMSADFVKTHKNVGSKIEHLTEWFYGYYHGKAQHLNWTLTY